MVQMFQTTQRIDRHSLDSNFKTTQRIDRHSLDSNFREGSLNYFQRVPKILHEERNLGNF